jgi:hypothetical protein
MYRFVSARCPPGGRGPVQERTGAMKGRRSDWLPILLSFLVLGALILAPDPASAQYDGSKSKPPSGSVGGTNAAGGGDPDNPIPMNGGSNPGNVQGGNAQIPVSLGEGEGDHAIEDLLGLLGTITGVLGSVLIL